MKFNKWLGLSLLAAAVGVAVWFVGKNETAEQVHYLTETVKRQNLDKTVLATGTVRANQRIEVGAQVSGKIQRIYVSLGQAVRSGELIAEIDSRNQQNSFDKAQAQLAVYRTQLKAKQTALSVAQANYQRYSKLYQQKSGSLSDLDSAKSTLAAAQAAVDELNSQIQIAEISVRDASLDLGYTKITSPIDGVIVSIPMSEGQTVNANQSSPTIVQVADLSKMQVKMEIAEGDIAQVKKGQAVEFNTLAEPQRRYRGEIESLDPALTSLSDNNYSEKSGNTDAVYYYANVLVDNRDQSLRIGMTTQSKVVIAQKNDILTVPTSAIKKQSQHYVVSVLEGDKAVEKEIQIGLQNSQYTEVVTGLTEGEAVIMTTRSASEKVGNAPMRMRF